MNAARTQLQCDEQEVINFIVHAFAKLAKSNSILVGLKIKPEDRENMLGIILEARHTYQQLCMCASSSITANPRAYSQFGSRQPSRQPSGQPSRQSSAQPFAGPSTMLPPPRPPVDTPIESVEDPGDEGQQATPKRAVQYVHDMVRPNIHLGIHYPMIAEEYSLPANVNTLLGENQHR